MFKQQLVRFKNRQNLLIAGVVLAVVFGGLGFGVFGRQQPETQLVQVQAAATIRASQDSSDRTASTSNGPTPSSSSTDAPVSPPSSNSTTTTNQVVAGTSTTDPTSMPTAKPPVPTPVITSLYLGQPYFDDNKAPIVTFTVPITASGSGNVTVAWVQDGSGQTLCAITIPFAANESKEVSCTVSLPSPPQGVWGTATAGSVYVKTATLVYIGGTSWE